MDAKRLTLDEFDRLLATCGSDPDRWPVLQRADAKALIGDSQPAARMLAEARALDRVLDRAPTPDAVRLQPLSERILAAAMAAAAPSYAPPASARILHLPVRKQSTTTPETPPRADAASIRTVRVSAPWRPAAALAASLMFGVMLGVADLAPPSAFGIDPSAEAASGEGEFLLSPLHGSGLPILDEDEQ